MLVELREIQLDQINLHPLELIQPAVAVAAVVALLVLMLLVVVTALPVS